MSGSVTAIEASSLRSYRHTFRVLRFGDMATDLRSSWGCGIIVPLRTNYERMEMGLVSLQQCDSVAIYDAIMQAE